MVDKICNNRYEISLLKMPFFKLEKKTPDGFCFIFKKEDEKIGGSEILRIEKTRSKSNGRMKVCQKINFLTIEKCVCIYFGFWR